jgi:hypothetical protein
MSVPPRSEPDAGAQGQDDVAAKDGATDPQPPPAAPPPAAPAPAAPAAPAPTPPEDERAERPRHEPTPPGPTAPTTPAPTPPEDERPERPRHEPSKRPVLWYVTLAILLVAVAAMMLYLTRGLTFNLDEWIVVTERRGPGAPSLLVPHNEHLSILIIGTFIVLLKIGGLTAIWLLMLPLVALQMGLGVLLFKIARARVGVGAAVGVAAFALLSGLAFENFLIPGQAGQMGSIVAGVGAFLVLDRPASKHNDRLLCGLMIVALCSSGLGIPVLVGVAVELLLTPAGRERLWVVGLPFGLYILWYVGYGTNRAGYHDLALSALWAWTAMGHAAGALIGRREVDPGQDLLIVLLVFLTYRTFRIPAASRIRLAAIATVLVTFYGLTALSRHDVAPPSSSRYLTVGLVFLLLMLVEAARGWKIRAWAPYVVILIALLGFSKDNKIAFKQGRTTFLERSQDVRASLGAVDLLGRHRVDPKLEIAPLAAPSLEAGHWFDTLDDLRGNPGYSASQLATAPAGARPFADDTLIRAGGLAVRPAPRRAPCDRPWTSTSGVVPAGGVRVQASSAMQLTITARRFGADWIMVDGLPLPAGYAVTLRPLPDASPKPYVLRAPGAAHICPL